VLVERDAEMAGDPLAELPAAVEREQADRAHCPPAHAAASARLYRLAGFATLTRIKVARPRVHPSSRAVAEEIMLPSSHVFANRAEAGRRLAERLVRFKSERPLVLALPRGGVPVGFEVAQALEAPLDLILVRKIGAPFQPELAIAAVVDGDEAEIVLNRDLVADLRISEGYLERERARQLEEIERRRGLYAAGRPRIEPRDRSAIVIDDGIATGATMEAALHAVRRAGPRRLVLAVPVAPPDTIERLRPQVDEVECLMTPDYFGAIGMFYADFRQLSDAEVIELLERAAARGSGEGEA
jgi:putative phosphoribosyl transferase